MAKQPLDGGAGRAAINSYVADLYNLPLVEHVFEDGSIPTAKLQDAGTFPFNTVTNGLTAHAGGGQGSATPLPSTVNRITTCANPLDSSLLPDALVGAFCYVINDGAQHTAVYPLTGDQIGSLAANAPVFIPGGGGFRLFTCAVAGRWSATPLAPKPKKYAEATTGVFGVGRLTGGSTVFYQNTGGTPGSRTTRTATQMFNDDPYAEVGGSYNLWIANDSTALGSLTVVAGSGVTLVGIPGSPGNQSITAAGTSALYIVEYTSATALTITYQVLAGI